MTAPSSLPSPTDSEPTRVIGLAAIERSIHRQQEIDRAALRRHELGILMALEQFCFGNKDSEKVFMHPLDMSQPSAAASSQNTDTFRFPTGCKVAIVSG